MLRLPSLHLHCQLCMLTFTECVKLLGNVLLRGKVVNGKWKCTSNTVSYFIYKIPSLTLVAASAGRSVGLAALLRGDLSDTLWSGEFLKGVLPHFFSPFLFPCQIYACCFVGDTVARGNFGLTVKALGAWGKKKSLWIIVSSKISPL